MAAHRQTMPAMMLAEVPPGMSAGSQFIVRAPNGQQVMVTLPPNQLVAMLDADVVVSSVITALAAAALLARMLT